MASEKQSDIQRVEQQRLSLEANLSRLQRSLKHWQTWEAEYEGLKEEIQASGEPTNAEQLLQIGREFGGDLVNEKEIRDLLGIKNGLRRSSSQIVDIISRRQEYVQQNIQTVQKQLQQIEDDQDSLSAAKNSGKTDDDGLPLTEITEQLDDDGNVISVSTLNPGQAEPKILEVLRKAGLKENDIESGEPSQNLHDRLSDADIKEAPSKSTEDSFQEDGVQSLVAKKDEVEARPLKKSVSFTNDTKPEAATRSKALPSNSQGDETRLKAPRKSVTFAEDAKLEAPSHQGQAAPHVGKVTAFDIAKDLPPGSRLTELDDDDNPVGTIIVPENESPEDAALRREMLQYNMQQVGAVVAELDLEDDLDDDDYDDDDLDFDELTDDEITSEPEDEDENGRTTTKVISDDYRKEMLDLEKKLNARMIEVVGPTTEIIDIDSVPSSGESPRTKPNENGLEDSGNTEKSRKKSVKFAERAEIVSPQEVVNSSESASALTAQPLAETITERKALPKQSTPKSQEPKKPSRFRKSLQADVSPTSATPEGPKDEILAGTLIERPNVPRAASPDPDGYDPAIHKREIAREFYDKRNKLIQQQGGFMPSQEEIDNPLMEEKDGKIRKVSRFRAARLSNSTGV